MKFEKFTEEQRVQLMNAQTDEPLVAGLNFLKGPKGILLLIILSAVVFFIFSYQEVVGVIAFYILVIFGLKSILNKRTFMREFAQRNGFQFQNTLHKDTLTGRLFKMTGNRVSNVVLGSYDNNPLRLFNYNYTQRQGKASHTFHFTVCEIEIEKTRFPHIFLQSRSMRKHHATDYFGQDKDIKISLPTQFEKSFNLYCTQNYGIEVLQIFTDELLQTLATHGAHISIEFADNKIYFYDDVVIKKHEELDNLYSVVQQTLDHADGLFHRLHDDFDAMHQFYKI